LSDEIAVAQDRTWDRQIVPAPKSAIFASPATSGLFSLILYGLYLIPAESEASSLAHAAAGWHCDAGEYFPKDSGTRVLRGSE
jgi:hypothetical protein